MAEPVLPEVEAEAAGAVASPPAGEHGARLDALWAELARASPQGAARPDFRFDPEHYAATYPDLPGDRAALLDHWRRTGAEEGRHGNRHARLRARLPALDAMIAPLVTEPRLVRALAEGVPGAGELAFELIALGVGVDAAVSDFSRAHYLRSYPDVERAGADPLLHYLQHGLLEGRTTLAGLRERHQLGGRAFDPGRATVLIATHEMSRTGAPIVALDLAREAAETMNVLVVSLRDGPLLEGFREVACEVLVSPAPLDEVGYLGRPAWDRIDLALVNSVEAYGLCRLLVARDIPFAIYVHEYPHYSLPLHKAVTVALYADLVVFSSEQVRETWVPRLRDVEFDVARDSAVVPQRTGRRGGVGRAAHEAARARLSRLTGRDLSEARIVCGAGAWQWRKGPDLFVSAAQIARGLDPSAVFIWIGDGLVREDLQFGVWMGVHLDRAGADEPGGTLFTLPAGDLYPDLLAAADAMFLSSRLDPLPNVVFDALEAGCRVVAFEGASGFSDAVYAEGVQSVEYGNPAAAARALLDLPPKDPDEAGGAPAPEPVFGRIAGLLRDRLRARRYHVTGAPGDGRTLLFSDRPADRPHRAREAERVQRLRRRMAWRDADDARESLALSGNWVHAACEVIEATAAEGPPPPFGLHWHAHYLDDLEADLGRPLVALARRLVITTDTGPKAEAIARIAEGLGLAPELRVVANRGRDVLPFLDLFGEGGPGALEAVWGHVHQKRSLGSGAQGDRWRRFLLDVLLGCPGGPAPAGPALAADPTTGLVAPFDPHFVPWHGSRALLPKVEPRLPGPLPENPLLFPVGNMFWARAEVVVAMRELWGPDHPWPNEPIASDGTEYHLIERLWPAVAASLGLRALFLGDATREGRR